MLNEEEFATNKEIGILCNGKRFRLNKNRIVAKREGKHIEIKERDTSAIFRIEGSLCIEEKIYQLSPLEEDLT